MQDDDLTVLIIIGFLAGAALFCYHYRAGIDILNASWMGHLDTETGDRL